MQPNSKQDRISAGTSVAAWRASRMLSYNPTKLRLFVKSQRVPVGVTEFSSTTPVGQWGVSRSSTRAVLYGRVLDEDQTRLVEEATRLSRSARMDLEVIDLAKMGVLRRAFMSRFVGPGLNHGFS